MEKILSLFLLMVLIAGCGSGEQSSAAKNSSGTSVAAANSNKSGDQALENKKRQLLQTGMEQLSQADVTDAIKTFGDVIKLDPKDTRGYFILVQTYIRLQNFEDASKILDTIITLEPDNGQAFYLKAVASGFLGQKDIAMVAAQKSAQLFQAKRDEENFKKSIALVQSLTNSMNEAAPAGQNTVGNAIIDPKEVSSSMDTHEDMVNGQEIPNSPRAVNRY